MEESIPSSIRAGCNRGIPPRVVIDFITQGELQNTTLKLAKYDEKVRFDLTIYDKQTKPTMYLYKCRIHFIAYIFLLFN